MGLHPSFKEVLNEKPISLDEMANSIVAIDAYNSLYQFLAAIRDTQGNSYMVNGKVVSHILGFTWKYEKLIKNYNIHLIFVFDGKPLELKQDTISERRQYKQDALENYNKAKLEGNVENMKKYGSRINYVTPDIVNSFKELILSAGQDYVDAEHDAEPLGCYLVNSGSADYFATQDTDAILYNCNKIVRNFGAPYKTFTYQPKLISSEDILKTLNITHEQLIYLAILTGTDFNKGIYGLGIKKALKYVRNANSIEEVVNNLGKDFNYNDDEKEKQLLAFKNAYNILTAPIDKNQIKIIKGSIDETKYNAIIKEAYLSIYGNKN